MSSQSSGFNLLNIDTETSGSSSGTSVGPVGPMGPQGRPGINGLNGVQGLAGANGINGTVGPQGVAGLNGTQGTAGTNGIAGPQGAAGPASTKGDTGAPGLPGAIGSTGPQGIAGSNGSNGSTGAPGPQGLQGTVGSNGLQGVKGAQGDIGSQGIAGLNGSTGPQGLAGPIGPSGIPGRDGLDGVAGPAGQNGLNGRDGLRGPPGTIGPTGAAGPAGPATTKGDTGPIGPIGPQGIAGTQGPAGPATTKGDTGPIGPMGPQGLQGIPGISGTDGVMGAQGIAGTQGPAGPATTKGDPGAIGPMGPQGIAGTQGPAGPATTKGDTGPIGTMGPQGLQGIPGTTGANGNIGATGPIGPQGPAGPATTKGDTGEIGPMGPQGIVGTQGPAGPATTKGDTGPIGPNGLQGSIGATGPQGAAGVNGSTGATGAIGPNGLQGSIGATGPQGAAGVNGSTGATGAIGQIGLQGAIGATGAQGSAGINGTIGPTGTSGALGATGPQGQKGDPGTLGSIDTFAVLDNNLSGTAIFPAAISNNKLTIYSIDIGSNYLQSTLLYPLTQNAGHSVSIDLSQTTKDRIGSSIRAVLDNNLSATAVFPAAISNNTLTIYSIDIGSDYLTSTLLYPLTQNAGHSVSIDLSQTTKNRLSSSTSVVLDKYLSGSGIFPGSIANNTFTLYPISAGSSYLTSSLLYPLTSDAGHSVVIDISDATKETIDYAVQRNQITLAATTSPTAIYNCVYTNTSTSVLLELIALDIGSTYLTIDKIDNAGNKTIRIDLSQNTKDKLAYLANIPSSSSLLSYDAPNDWNIVNRRLVIQATSSSNGMLKLVPTTDDNEASIGFYQKATTASATNNVWSIGNNAWGSGGGNFGIGCSKLGSVLTIDGTSGNINSNRNIYINGSSVKNTYTLPNNWGSGGWYNIGSTSTPAVNVKIEFVCNSYNNDTNAAQDSIVILRWKPGSTSSDFKGNAQAYKLGQQLYSPDIIRIVQDDFNSNLFTFYASFRPYTSSSMVTITTPGIFTFNGSFSETPPTDNNYINVTPFQVFTQETKPSANDITDLATLYYSKTDIDTLIPRLTFTTSQITGLSNYIIQTNDNNSYVKSVVTPAGFDSLYGYIVTTKSGNTVTIDYSALVTTMTNFADAIVATPNKYSITQQNSITAYFRLGILTLPQGGLHAKITLMSCQGYALSGSFKSTSYPNPQNYCCEIYVYSGNATRQYTSPGDNSLALAAGSNTSGLIDSGCFHYGFVSNNSKWARPSNVYLCPRFSNPMSQVDIWVQSTAYWGNPVIEVLTNGTWENTTAQSTSLPNTGWVVLPFQTNTAV